MVPPTAPPHGHTTVIHPHSPGIVWSRPLRQCNGRWSGVQWMTRDFWWECTSMELETGTPSRVIPNWDWAPRCVTDSGAGATLSPPCTPTTLALSSRYEPSSQILSSDRSRKPQSSHLQTRVDYLLRLLQKESAGSRKKVGWAAEGWCTNLSPALADRCRVAGRGRPLWKSSLQWPSEAGRPLWQLPVVGSAGGGALPGRRLRRAARARVRTRWMRTSSHLLQSALQVGGPMGGDRGRQPQLLLLPLERGSLGHPRGYGDGRGP